mmetsp:Transcript_129197/g.288794  ORF Transcript_129197/g.288794 Transcript_129197/m.288794 type:complete len:452 (+) Transcript_129197:141-1496(+)
MDYFGLGGRQLLSRFPPHIPGIFNPNRFPYDPEHPALNSQIGQASAAAPQCPRAEDAVPGGDVGPRGCNTKEVDCFAYLGGLPAKTQSQQLLEEVDDIDIDPQPGQVKSAQAGNSAQAEPVKAPAALHRGFNANEVQAWDAGRFELVRKIQDATRNRGQVHLMRDSAHDTLVAVKQMPNRWIRTCHSEFVMEHPSETEMPWQDVGCIRFLHNAGYSHVCELLGVYRDDSSTYVVTSFATEGDLFSWCEAGVPPGREREVLVQPLARQMLEAVQQLHDYSIVHRDLSLENILMSKLPGDGSLQILIIDFSMASTLRRFRKCVRGKASYQAPELHMDEEYDAFLTDAFSMGVTLYAVLVKDYPWLSTRPGGCKCFEYVKKHGFRSYLNKRKMRNASARVAECMSEPLIQLLEGLLELDPAKRLTLGESSWTADGQPRRSVWDMPWMHDGPGPG